MRKELNDILNELGYLPLRDVQKKCIPLITEGKDWYIQAETGAGKTAAYLIPLIDACDEESMTTSALVIAPTREIALQSAQEAQKLAVRTQVHIITAVGGMDRTKQENALKHRPHIVIGTPGRILDLLQAGILDLSSLQRVILDEADQIISTGQREDVTRILQYTHGIQTVCLSATWSDLLNSFFPGNFEKMIINDPQALNTEIKACREMTEDKKASLYQILRHLPVTSCIVFMNHRSDALNLAEILRKQGILASSFSAYFEEKKRLQILEQFRKGEIRVLIATDAAARGLDLPEVSHIIHYDLPVDYETYIHRSGRTAHQGGSGVSIALISQEDFMTPVGSRIVSETDMLVLEDQVYDLTVPVIKAEKKKAAVQQFLIRAGKKDKIRPKDIIGALCTVIPFEEIGVLEIQEKYSTVTVLNTDPFLAGRLDRLKIKGKERRIEIRRES